MSMEYLDAIETADTALAIILNELERANLSDCYNIILHSDHGGIMVYDVTTPAAPKFVQYVNTRDFSGDSESGTAGDLGPEGLIFIPKTESPGEKPLLVVGYEVSGSTSIYEINADDLLLAGDIDGDGVITILDARKLVKMYTRPRCLCK